MPTTTPESRVSHYGNNENHFEHVLDYLFCPAIERAGLDPVRPIAELTYTRITEHLDSAELVLCDMSCLNPNVFFQLGIRTALNKPVCLVHDGVFETVPFDTAIISCHTYDIDLASREPGDQVERLKDHIEKSTTGGRSNALWHHFGVSAHAHSLSDRTVEETDRVDRLEYLAIQVDAIREQLSRPNQVNKSQSPKINASSSFCVFEMEGDIDSQIRFHKAVSALPDVKVIGPTRWDSGANQFTLYCNGALPKGKIHYEANSHKLKLRRLPSANAHSWRRNSIYV